MPSDTYRWASTRSVTLRSLCEPRSDVDQFRCAPRRALGAPPGSSGEGSCKLKRLTLCNHTCFINGAMAIISEMPWVPHLARLGNMS